MTWLLLQGHVTRDQTQSGCGILPEGLRVLGSFCSAMSFARRARGLLRMFHGGNTACLAQAVWQQDRRMPSWTIGLGIQTGNCKLQLFRSRCMISLACWWQRGLFGEA